MGAVRRGIFVFAIASVAALSLSSIAFTADASDDAINVMFWFDPPKQAYCPEENFTIMVSVTNALPSGDYVYELKVTNVSVHFSWMAPNEYCWRNVSNESSWLNPDGPASETYELGMCVPDEAVSATYSYSFRIEYLRHSWYGDIPDVWGTDETYRDFVVSAELEVSAEGDKVDLSPYLVFVAVVLSIGAIGAVAYQKYAGAGAASGPARTSGFAREESYPAIGPMPGEHFPVEIGFLYLVKEKRPRVAFDMFNEAVSHGAKGMLVAREHPNRLRRSHDFQAEKILWLTRRTGVDHIDPTELSLLNLKITKFVESTDRAVVLVEGLEYTITQNDFESVLRFVNHLHDFVLIHDCAVILVIDPRVLTTRELALLERAAKIVEPFEEHEAPLESAAGEGSG
ncbi:MAG: DUF835 domain-containing protein [Thermoplasmata archaeon]|nr:DUF835 domain-containing protein [Thermoplasmata archaeon]